MARTAMHPLKIVAALGAAFLVWGLVLAYASSPAQAATITVNSLADDANATDGECTLREAITSANTNTTFPVGEGECAAGSGDDVIDIGATGTVDLTGALPDLSSNIDLEGPGADKFTVRRNTGGDYNIFTVTSGSVVSISGITISNGKANLGGGVNNGGTLTISASTISNNSASGGNSNVGGGIFNDRGGTVTISASTISNNSGNSGGGVYNSVGTLTISASTISDNSAGYGGGVFSNTRLSGPKTTITNTTISANTATNGGGGVFNPAGLTVIEHSTITNNSAPTNEGSGVGSSGDTFTSTQVLSSIISPNTNTDVDFLVLVGLGSNSFDSEGYNLIGDGNATAAFNQAGDQSGVSDPKLGALADNGGATKTHALLSDSLAINAIAQGTNGCGTTFAQDQRGVSRPQGSACDIGAFELVVVPNSPPSAVSDSYATNEDTPLNVTAPGVLSNDTDSDGDTLSANLVSGPSHGDLTLNANGSFSYSPAPNYNGEDSFTYNANDTTEDSGTATVSITVTAVNDAPTVAVAAGGHCGRSGTTTKRINLTLADTESAAADLTLGAISSNQTLVPDANISLGGSGASRSLTLSARPMRSGTATLTVSVSDEDQMTNSIPITVKVGTKASDTLIGSAQTDMVFGRGGNDTIDSLGANDLLCADKGRDTLNGGAGDDTLDGSNGNDRLRGQAGKDILRGNRGDDTLTGGSDADSFRGGSGTDTATDFNAGEGDTKDDTIP